AESGRLAPDSAAARLHPGYVAAESVRVERSSRKREKSKRRLILRLRASGATLRTNGSSKVSKRARMERSGIREACAGFRRCAAASRLHQSTPLAAPIPPATPHEPLAGCVAFGRRPSRVAKFDAAAFLVGQTLAQPRQDRPCDDSFAQVAFSHREQSGAC